MRTRDNTKELLVKEVACEILVQEGFQGFSMNKLARACGISVATLYIYYQDKDDLIRKLGIEIGKAYYTEMMKDFSPDMSFKEGLRKQWENRSRFAVNNPIKVKCHEIIRTSSHNDYVMRESMVDLKSIFGLFIRNAVERNELKPMSREVFWSIAYGPLYALLRFHHEGKSIGNVEYKLSQKDLNEAFDLVIKALC